MRDLDERIDEENGLGRLRSDAATNTRSIVWLIVRYTDWPTMTCRIGWQNLVDLSGLSRATVRRVIRRLRDWGFLGVVETGSTWRTRGCRQDDDEGDRGAEYVLCVPSHEAVEISDPPSLGSRREPEKPHVRARETAPDEQPRPWPMHQPPRTRGQRLTATRRLRNQAPVLARLTDRQLRNVLRPWYDHGWSPAQIRYALDHQPDGTPHWHTADVRHVAGWIRSRLGQWAGHTPARQLGAGQATDLTAADVAALPRADAQPVADTAAHASLARRLLAATRRRSDKTVRRGLGINLPAGDGTAAATAVEEHVELGGDGGDWLLRNAARRAEPDLMRAFGGLDLGAIA
jgi:hypothetical protein